MNLRMVFMACLTLMVSVCFAQDTSPENWFNLDASSDNVNGVSTEKTYQSLLKGKTSTTVIVAVIDSGVDAEHEDLKDVMWINSDEIPGNGIDDDKNGYVDDIHGWNFIGGADGKNVNKDTYELTRLYKKYKDMYEGKDVASLSKSDKKGFAKYEKIKEKLESKRSEILAQSAGVMKFKSALEAVQKHVGKKDLTNDDVKGIKTDDAELTEALGMISRVMESGNSIADLQKEIEGAADYFSSSLDYAYNPEFDPRNIVGDNYSDSNQRGYGNNDVEGPDAGHGTHVAGIIAAVRDNDLGVKGVADNVRIMSVRAVPDGDERDKDVANAIRYAVDNGATIINMSFGKAYSWDKGVVDAAVKHAVKNDVLLVHAAGNSALNTDVEDNFPHDKYSKKGLFKPKSAKTWLEIGALSWKSGADAAATFSNYGKSNVDVFAPGVQILSTTPDQGYEKFSGTSMAAPVTAGVAAVLRSYFPKLSAKQVKSIIMESIVPVNQKVKQPGTKKEVSFSELCQTGGIVNAYEAVRLAAKTKGKKKVKSIARP